KMESAATSTAPTKTTAAESAPGKSTPAEAAATEARSRLGREHKTCRHNYGQHKSDTPGNRQPTSAVHLRFSFISRNLILSAPWGICGSKSPAGKVGSNFHRDNTAEYWGAMVSEVYVITTLRASGCFPRVIQICQSESVCINARWSQSVPSTS